MTVDHRRQFIRELEMMSQRRSVVSAFGDAVGMMSAALWSATLIDSAKAEKAYRSYADKYSREELQHMDAMFSTVVNALEERRESFLGPVLEAVGAANTRNGQFLTPACVSDLMARVCGGGIAYEPGNVLKLNDPACGGGVTLISQGESLLRYRHVAQRDIMIYAGDIDRRACDMTYVELTLLGYAARVDHMDALTMQVYSEPRWTLGYFLHSMPMRGVR